MSLLMVQDLIRKDLIKRLSPIMISSCSKQSGRIPSHTSNSDIYVNLTWGFSVFVELVPFDYSMELRTLLGVNTNRSWSPIGTIRKFDYVGAIAPKV